MGQYHWVVNLTKKEYLHPHKFNEGLKIMEFGQGSERTMTALAILLASSLKNKDGSVRRGGGDPCLDDEKAAFEYVGRWAGDRIAIIGDYAEKDDPVKVTMKKVKETYTDISDACVAAFSGEVHTGK